MKLDCQKGKLEKLSRRKIRLPEKLAPQLSYLVGALRDGSISQTYTKEGVKEYVAWCSKSRKYLEIVIVPLIVKVFGIKPRIVKDRNKFQVRTSIHAVVEFFKKAFDHPGGKQTTWRTPHVILQANEKIKLAYIRGFFDAEGGSIKLMQRYPGKACTIRIWLSWKDPNICVPLEEMKYMLEEFSINSQVKKVKSSSKKTKLPTFCLKI